MAIEKLGRYEITGELGKGAMGTVYRAVDPLIERTVAIKTINLDLPKDELAAFQERFYREAKSAGRLNHPNVVTIYDVGESNNIAYIAMEFLEGQSLREILDSGAPLSLDRKCEIAAQIADGLAYAQEFGIVHRDIKPANIMITRLGHVKITDFGVAHLPTGSKTQAGTIVGSPKYMSPEQVVGKPVDGRSDIFSLGVLLYEMLAGAAPFRGDTVSTIMYHILNEMPARATQVKTELPPAFDHILGKALAKLPEARYASAAEFAGDLRNYKNLALPAAAIEIWEAPQNTLERRAARRKSGADATVVQPAGGPEPEFAEIAQAAVSSPVKKARPKILAWAVAGVAGIIVAVSALMFLGKAPGGKPGTGAEQTTPEPPASASPAVPAEEPAAKKDDGAPSVARDKQSAPAAPAARAAAAKPPAPAIGGKKGEHEKRGAPGGPTGFLVFQVNPGGEVYVDGNKVGTVPPLTKLPVAPGAHQVVIKNADYMPYTVIVKANVEANGTTPVYARFQTQ